jgi:ribose transport system substrate-binding protein
MPKKLHILVSLTTTDNDYQMEESHFAEQAASKVGARLEIVFADNDPITQSTQLLRAVHEPPESRPDAIAFEPVGGTALPQVGRAAVRAGIGWVVLNRDALYLPDLRKTTQVPVFGVSSDHVEIGRIQGRQLAALLPHGGAALYIQGPSEDSAAKGRTLGIYETKPTNIHLTVLKGQWTEESGVRAVRQWLQLSTAQKSAIDVIAAQNDAMAVGARKAFEELPDENERELWFKLPFTGCDGLPKTGQEWVRSGLLTASIFVPSNSGPAIEMLAEATQKRKLPPERVLIQPKSFPALEALTPVHRPSP